MESLFRGMGVGAGVVRFGATRFDVDNYVRDGFRGETLLYTKFMIVLSSTETGAYVVRCDGYSRLCGCCRGERPNETMAEATINKAQHIHL